MNGNNNNPFLNNLNNSYAQLYQNLLQQTTQNQPVQQNAMTATPAAVEEYFNVAAGDNIAIRCGCCQTLTVTNVSDIPVSVANANLLVSKKRRDV